MSDTGIVVDDKQAELAFDAGFTTETPPPKTAAVVEAAPKAEPVVPKVEPKVAAKVVPKVEPKAPKPEYVQITKEQLANFEATATKTATFETQLAKVFGTMGQTKQILDKLQTATPSGQTIKLPEKFLAKTRKDFPELADQIEDDLREALKDLRGTGPTSAQGATSEEVQKLIASSLEAAHSKREMKTLGKKHPTWRDIVGAVDSFDKVDPNNEFRKWLAKQTPEYQAEINDADEASTISEAIDKFLAAKAKAAIPATPSPKDAAAIERKKLLAAAVTPKGDGGQPPPPKTVDDAFNEGFASR